jgi:hypothetical protein
LLLLFVSLLSTGFVFALWMSCLDASSVPVGVREESRCCYLSVGLGRPKRARSHRNTVLSQRVKRIILGRLFVERHVRLLGVPEVMEQHGQLACYGNDGLALGLFATSSG